MAKEVDTMMQAYRREDTVSFSKASRHLGEIINVAKRKGHVVLSRNNRPETVILPIKAYEAMIQDREHLLTALEVQERKAMSRGKRISWDSLKTKCGL